MEGEKVHIAASSIIYLIQVMTGKEHTYVRHIKRLSDRLDPFTLLVPSRQLTHRRRGRSFQVVKPVFPGYIFLVCEETGIGPDTRTALRRTPGFIRYIRNESGELTPLTPHDRELLVRLTATGETSRRSVVTFDKNNRVVPLSGPLKACEGTIIKIDRRKRRARVKFLLNDKRFLIDFEYEEIAPIKAETK